MRVVALLLSLVVVASLGACSKKPCPSGSIRVGNQCKKIPDAGGGADGSFEGDAGAASDDESGDGDAKLDDGGSPGPIGEDGGTEPVTCVPPACDPCELDPAVCLNGGVCSTTATGFECACAAGFSGSTCKVDVCVTDPCDHGTCTRSRAGRSCECEDDWQGDACDTNTNPLLASLEPSAGALWPPFEPSTSAYTLEVGVDAPTVALTPVAFQPGGVKITVNGAPLLASGASQSLAVPLNGAKALTLVVEADDGSTASYEVGLRRTLVQQAYIKSSQTSADDAFGSSTASALLLDGSDMLYVGNPNDALVEVFQRASGSWAPSLKLDETQGTTHFGKSLARSDEWLAVGADDAVLLFPKRELGAAFPHVQVLDVVDPDSMGAVGFGEAIALTDSWLAVGVSRYGGGGCVVVHRLVDGIWTYHSTLGNPQGLEGDAFGSALAMEGRTLVVGAPHVGVPKGNGAAYIYELEDTAWALRRTVDGGDEPAFANSVAISDGRVAIASPYLDLGGGGFGSAAIDLYEKSGNSWRSTATVSVPTPPASPAHLSPNGFALAIAFESNVLVAGAALDKVLASGVNPEVDPNGTDVTEVGAVYVFVESPTGWSRAAYVKSSNGELRDQFGASVAVSGSTIAVGAPNEDSSATTINGDQTDNSASDSGAIYVFGIDCATVPEGADVDGC